jgi:hypothetical protein
VSSSSSCCGDGDDDDADDGIAAQAASSSSSPTCVMQNTHFDLGDLEDTTTSPIMYRTVSGEAYDEMQGSCVTHAHGGGGNPPNDEEELDLDFLGDYYEDMY